MTSLGKIVVLKHHIGLKLEEKKQMAHIAQSAPAKTKPAGYILELIYYYCCCCYC